MSMYVSGVERSLVYSGQPHAAEGALQVYTLEGISTAISSLDLAVPNKVCYRHEKAMMEICMGQEFHIEGHEREVQKIRYESIGLDLTVLGYPSGGVKLELVYLPADTLIGEWLSEAGLDVQRVKGAVSEGFLITHSQEEMEKVYQMLISHYYIQDRDFLLYRAVKYGTWRFPELDLKVDCWGQRFLENCEEKLLIFQSGDLRFSIHGLPGGDVKFELFCKPGDKCLKQRLLEFGISQDRLSPGIFVHFESCIPEELGKIYSMISVYHPLCQHRLLVESLVKYGTWRFSELDLKVDCWDQRFLENCEEKLLIFESDDLRFSIHGLPGGDVKFELFCKPGDKCLKQRLLEFGISPDRLSSGIFVHFESCIPEELGKIYSMISVYHPLRQHRLLVESLVKYGDWQLSDVMMGFYSRA